MHKHNRITSTSIDHTHIHWKEKTHPVCNHLAASIVFLVFSSSPQYSVMTEGPRTQSSPDSLVGTISLVLGTTIFTCEYLSNITAILTAILKL